MLSESLLALAPEGPSDLPWVEVGPGVTSKVLALFPNDAGWISLLRLQPGARIPLHRHKGEVHGFLLEGQRRLGSGGRVVGPGSYEYEPLGNTDTWWVEGDRPLVSLFVVRGAVEYLDAQGQVKFVETSSSKERAYRDACLAQGFQMKDLYVA